MTVDRSPSESPSEHTIESPEAPARILNVPNLLCAIRLLGSPLLVILALFDQTRSFVALLIVLLLTDWLDGKLAVRWKQQTTLGARLDSIADAAMYSALLFGAVWLKWDVLRSEVPWIVSVATTYALSVGIGLTKFGCWPSYHTRAAKVSWLLTSIGAVTLFAGGSIWPLRIAAMGVTLTNLEAAAMSCLLDTRRTDVPSLYHVWRDRRREVGES